MTNPRLPALLESGIAVQESPHLTKGTNSEHFGRHVFNQEVMKKMLPGEVFDNLVNAMSGKEPLNMEYSDIIATALKDWALAHGVTHYSHWFQPLSGIAAEKHDSFIEWETHGERVIEEFSGKQLIQGEPDASSFPSGGLRSTFEARGYTGWDPTSPPFLWKGGDGYTLCIPSVFFSWTGQALDCKIPLLRSDAKIKDAVKRLLKITGIEADHVYSTVGLEQEYFIVERLLRNLRPDLLILGKTVVGAPPPKGQELQDHYFGTVKDRVLSFMRDFEQRAIELGIPVKTRHNEVAPAQHEVAPVYEKSTLAVDHNLILMELMRHTAHRHDLSLLLHEKPFAGLNGSGKHSNWSLATDTGLNLLDPTETPENNLHFLILLVSILHGVWKHSALLRASIGSAGNDDRLGGHEAPPAIMSVYLGEELENLLNNIEVKGSHISEKKGSTFNLGLGIIPELKKDQTDRNRTSPFAFTGNKFEFRAVGSAQNVSMPTTILNAIVAESLNDILDALEEQLSKNPTPKELIQEVLPVLQPFIKASKPVRFHGDNYSLEWVEEAKNRGLPNLKTSVEAFKAFLEPQTIRVFANILTEEELHSRYEVALESYVNNVEIEAKLLVEIFKTQILPPALETLKNRSEAIIHYREAIKGKGQEPSHLIDKLNSLSELIESTILDVDFLEAISKEASSLSLVKRADLYSTRVRGQCGKVREAVDQLETIVDDQLWPLPKYRELLWLI